MAENPPKVSRKGDKMRELINEKDWRQTPLGAQKEWPQRLKATVDLILDSNFPMIILWGEEFIQIYNEAYCIILQDKHPEGLGQPTKECWPEGWKFNKPVFERVLNGETVTLEDQPYTIDRRKPHEEVRFTACHSPICNKSGETAGILAIVFETTDRLKFEKRREQYEKDLHKREERKSFMLQFEDDIRGLEDSRAVMQKAAESIGRKLNVDRAGYAGIDESGEYLMIKTDWTSGKVPSLKGRLRIADFGAKMIEELSAGNLISFNDHLNSIFTEGVASNYEGINNRACIKAPLMRGNEFRALFFVHQSESREWTDEDKKLVHEMADRTWHAVERARAEEVLRQNREQLSEDLTHMRRLHKLFRKLANEFNLNTALQKILSAACEFSDTSRGTVQLVNDDSDRDEIAACQGYEDDSEFVKYFLEKGCDLACNIAHSERKRVITENIRTSPDFQGTKDRKVALDEGILAQQSIPMITREGKVVGVLSTQFDKPHQPSDRELRLIDLLAWTAAEFIERNKTDEALRESEERYRSLFESMDEGYCIIQMIFDEDDKPVDYRFLETNPAFEELTGLKNAEGKRMLEMTPEHENHWFEKYGKVAKTGESIRFEQEAEYLPQPSIYDVYAFRFDKPEERKVAILFSDISEIKQTQQELREFNETLEERVERRTEALTAYQERLRKLANKLSITEEEQRHYLATELHDNLGQLLAVIKMNLDMVKRDDMSEKAVKQLQEVDDTVHKSIRYTRQLMSELKPPPGLKEAKFEDILCWLQDKMKQHGLKVLINDGVKMKPLADESQVILQQSIRELLYNVVKHGGVKEAYISLKNLNGRLKIDVKDNGKGFDLDSKELRPTTEGGFGLFNIKERLEMIGGAFKINSEPGKGTTATLLAPLKGAQEATGQEATGQEATGNGQPTKELIKILLVDDHQLVREGLRSLINREEDMAVVAEAKNGVEAVDLAGEVEPDIIVMDVNMPKMGGIEATQKITKGDGRLRIIGLSIHDKEKGEEAIRQAGASVYLTKDEATETLCATIRSEYETLQ